MNIDRQPYFRVSLWAHVLGAVAAILVLVAIIALPSPNKIVPTHVLTSAIGMLLGVRFLAEWGYRQYRPRHN